MESHADQQRTDRASVVAPQPARVLGGPARELVGGCRRGELIQALRRIGVAQLGRRDAAQQPGPDRYVGDGPVQRRAEVVDGPPRLARGQQRLEGDRMRLRQVRAGGRGQSGGLGGLLRGAQERGRVVEQPADLQQRARQLQIGAGVPPPGHRHRQLPVVATAAEERPLPLPGHLGHPPDDGVGQLVDTDDAVPRAPADTVRGTPQSLQQEPREGAVPAAPLLGLVGALVLLGRGEVGDTRRGLAQLLEVAVDGGGIEVARAAAGTGHAGAVTRVGDDHDPLGAHVPAQAPVDLVHRQPGVGDVIDVGVVGEQVQRPGAARVVGCAVAGQVDQDEVVRLGVP
jgi:hypothetical protein